MPETSTGIAYDHVQPAGSSAPLVFIHAGVADRRMWDPQWELLRADFELIRLDLRGYGWSTTPPPGGSFAHARDVIDTMDELGCRSAHLIGSSFGAGVAVEVALTAPERVDSLLLCPPGGSLLATLTDTLREFFAAEAAALDAGDLDAAVEANVQAWLVGRDRRIDDLDPDVVARVRQWQRRAFEAADQLGDVEEVELDPSALDRLADVVAPTLALVGGHDMDTTHDSVQRLAAGIPTIMTIEWPTVAHLPSLEEPERFSNLLQDWIQDRHDHRHE